MMNEISFMLKGWKLKYYFHILKSYKQYFLAWWHVTSKYKEKKVRCYKSATYSVNDSNFLWTKRNNCQQQTTSDNIKIIYVNIN